MYTNIMVALDFSSLSEKLVAKAKALGDTFNSEITLVHAIDYLPPPYVRPEIPEIYASEKLMAERAMDHINKLKEKYEIKKCTAEVRVGRAKEVVLEVNEEYKPDLLIMAKHSRQGLTKLLGSTTNGVLQKVGCEVLVMPE